jgi:hypothetical protein
MLPTLCHGGATDWPARVLFPLGERDFSVLHSVQTGSGTYLMGTGGCFLGVKQPGSEADRSLHLVPRTRRVELYFRFPVRLQDIPLHSLSIGISIYHGVFIGLVHVLICCLLWGGSQSSELVATRTRGQDRESRVKIPFTAVATNRPV